MHAEIISSEDQHANTRSEALWVIQIVTAVGFLMAGSDKLVGEPWTKALFDKIGAGQWLRFLTGGVEVLGAVGLLTTFASALAALALFGVMFGAVVADALILGGRVLPALVLLVSTGIIAWGRRSQLALLMRVIAYSL